MDDEGARSKGNNVGVISIRGGILLFGGGFFFLRTIFLKLGFLELDRLASGTSLWWGPSEPDHLPRDERVFLVQHARVVRVMMSGSGVMVVLGPASLGSLLPDAHHDGRRRGLVVMREGKCRWFERRADSSALGRGWGIRVCTVGGGGSSVGRGGRDRTTAFEPVLDERRS